MLKSGESSWVSVYLRQKASTQACTVLRSVSQLDRCGGGPACVIVNTLRSASTVVRVTLSLIVIITRGSWCQLGPPQSGPYGGPNFGGSLAWGRVCLSLFCNLPIWTHGKSRGARVHTHTRTHTDACASPHVAPWILQVS